MSIANSSQFYLNIKDKPKWIDNLPFEKQTRDARQFMEEEGKKILKGLVINGVKIHPWMYWHVNFWNMMIDEKVEGEPLPISVSKPATLRDNEWLLQQCLIRAEQENKGIIGFGARRIGKELADYEPVITINGEVPIGEIKVGDTVFGKDGRTTKVTGVFPQGVKPIYRLYLEDGRHVDCGLEHQWGVITNNGEYSVVTTRDILESDDIKSYSLPQCEPVQFQEKKLFLKPLKVGITSRYIESGQFIDERYKQGSVRQRIELLRGLIERNKVVNFKYIKIESENLDFLNDIAYICRSLGIKCKVSKSRSKYFGLVKTKNNITIYLSSISDLDSEEIFFSSTYNSVKIERLEYIGDFSATCIMVDNDDHLFLTRDFIVTHNSAFISSYIGHSATTKYGGELRINSIVGGSQEDLDNITGYIGHGLDNIHPYFSMDRVGKDWDKGVTLGVRNIDNSKEVFSTIKVTNVVKGAISASQKTAGATPNASIWDEALWEEELVFTEDGPKKIKDVNRGSMVYGPFGNATEVLEKVDVGHKQLYKFQFSNGSSVEACEDHLWEVKVGKNPFELKTTGEIIQDLRKKIQCYIRTTEPVNFPFKRTEIDPYLVGFYTFHTKMSKRSIKPEIDEETFSTIKYFGDIPNEYLYNSPKVRLSVINGIFDAAGYTRKSGKTYVSTLDRDIFDNLVFLMSSMGIAYSISTDTSRSRERYILTLSDNVNLYKHYVSNEQSSDIYGGIKSEVTNSLVNILSITPTKVAQAYCLKVNSMDGLFLTSNFIVTHNCGKFNFMKAFNAFKYSIATQWGWRTVPLLFGCLTENNRVWTATGDLISIKDLKASDGIVGYDQEAGGYSIEPITHQQSNYMKECLRLETFSGKVVECSYDHPILRMAGGNTEFVEAKDLKPDDTICLIDSIPLFGDVEIEDDNFDPYSTYMFNLSKESSSKLIRKLFEEVGNLNDSFIEFEHKDTEFIDNLAHLLLKFGIHSNKLKGPKSSWLIVNDFRSLVRAHKLLFGNYNNFDFCSDYRDNYDYSNNVRIEDIDSIQNIGEKLVYNLTADKTNTYLSGAVITHNTGAVAEYSKDAKKMVNNPSGYNMLAMDWSLIGEDGMAKPWVEREWGVFLPAQMSLDSGIPKKRTTLGKFLKNDSPDLADIGMEVTEWVESTQIIKQRREVLKKTDAATYNDEVMFMPLDTDDCFLDIGKNPFPIAEANKQLNDIRLSGDTGRRVDVHQVADGSNRVIFTDSSKPIASSSFEGGILDCAIKVFEDPNEDNSFDYTYVAGLDHYKHTESSGDSLGALYIFKRKVNINDSFADSIVCSYVSRPPSMNTFNRTCEILLEGYGAQCLQENADISFQQYLESKSKDIKLLANGQEIVTRMISSDSRQLNKYGLSPTPKNKEYYFNLVVSYCWEEVDHMVDEEGNGVKVLGVTRIHDEELLEEIIDYKPGKNSDRIVAFGHALVWARYLDDIRLIPKVKGQAKAEKNYEDFAKKREEVREKIRGSKYGSRRYSTYSRGIR